jgi:hypothetical protein
MAKSEMKKVASVMVMILAIVVVFIFEQVDSSPACDTKNGLICLAKCLKVFTRCLTSLVDIRNGWIVEKDHEQHIFVTSMI